MSVVGTFHVSTMLSLAGWKLLKVDVWVTPLNAEKIAIFQQHLFKGTSLTFFDNCFFRYIWKRDFELHFESIMLLTPAHWSCTSSDWELNEPMGDAVSSFSGSAIIKNPRKLWEPFKVTMNENWHNHYMQPYYMEIQKIISLPVFLIAPHLISSYYYSYTSNNGHCFLIKCHQYGSGYSFK